MARLTGRLGALDRLHKRVESRRQHLVELLETCRQKATPLRLSAWEEVSPSKPTVIASKHDRCYVRADIHLSETGFRYLRPAYGDSNTSQLAIDRAVFLICEPSSLSKPLGGIRSVLTQTEYIAGAYQLSDVKCVPQELARKLHQTAKEYVDRIALVQAAHREYGLKPLR